MAQLIDHSDEFSDGDIALRILDLQTLIEVKADAGRVKDRLVLPVLMAVLRERTRSPGKHQDTEDAG